MTTHMTGTREEWLAARLELLEAEKELTRRSDELARRRQELIRRLRFSRSARRPRNSRSPRAYLGVKGIRTRGRRAVTGRGILAMAYWDDEREWRWLERNLIAAQGPELEVLGIRLNRGFNEVQQSAMRFCPGQEFEDGTPEIAFASDFIEILVQAQRYHLGERIALRECRKKRFQKLATCRTIRLTEATALHWKIASV
jgi:hypothetical protein